MFVFLKFKINNNGGRMLSVKGKDKMLRAEEIKTV